MGVESKRVLFVSIYAEVVKSMLPYMRAALAAGYDVRVVAKHYPFGDDRVKSEKLLDGVEYELVESLDLGDMESWRRGKCLTSRWCRLGSTLFNSLSRAWKANSQAADILERFDPDVLIVASDGRILERYLIKHSQKKTIPSICIQWTLSVISSSALLESKSRRLTDCHVSLLDKFENLLYRQSSFLVRIINGVGYRLLNLRTPLTIRPTQGVRIHGQGNANRLALIGEASKRFHLEMGTPVDKLAVIGSPRFDLQYQRYISSLKNPELSEIERKQILKKYSFAPDTKIVLIANNDSRKQYSKYYTNEEIVSAWRNRIANLLIRHPNLVVIFKLHPVWNTSDEFDGLQRLSPNVHILKTGDMEELIRIADVLVVRHSMAALEGIIRGVPTVSINLPQMPAGQFYKDVGGTIHVETEEEFVRVVSKFLVKDVKAQNSFAERKNKFIRDCLGVSSDPVEEGADKRFVDLLDEMIRKR